MTTINANKDRLTEAQQKEIVERCNESYDRGGADALKFVIDAAKQIAVDMPGFSEHAAFTVYVVEAIREKLAAAVNEQVHDTIPEESRICIP